MCRKTKVLFIGAHTDDIELGAGASMLSMCSSSQYKVLYVSLSRCTDLERNASIAGEQNRVRRYLNSIDVDVEMHDFPNRRLYSYDMEIRELLFTIRKRFDPDIVFTHWYNDTHQDHSLIYQEAVRTFKTQTLLLYQIANSCLDFVPNFFIPVSKECLDKKNKLLSFYKSQQSCPYMNPLNINAQAKLYGLMCGHEYAEAFYALKAIWEPLSSCVSLL